MTAKGGFTSAGQLGPNRAEGAHQHLPILAAPSTSSKPAHQSEPSPSAVLVNPDLHRRSHSSSKLPAFRFTDRRASSTSGNSASKADTPLSVASAQRNHNRIPSQDLKNNNNNNNTTTTITASDGSHNPITDPSTSTSTSTSLAPATSQNTSAALPLQPSLALHAPSPPVSPNPGSSVAPASVSLPVPGALPSTASADPGPLAPPSSSASGPVAAPDIFSAPATAPATTHSDLSHPTTHHHDEKHADTASVSASASATIIASANTASPTELSPTDDASPPLLRSRSRASSFQPSSDVSVVEPSPQAKRPASVPDAPAPVQSDTLSPHPSNKNRTRRSLVSRRSTAAAASTGPPLSLNAERLHAIEAIEAAQGVQGAHASYPSSSDGSAKDSPSSGQRELILPKTLSKPTSIDERRASLSQRPPVSYRPPLSVSNNTEPPASNPVRVPPIRAFRSSGSRKSLTLDMNSRSRYYDFGDDGLDSNHDQTLRALEGRADHEVLHSAPAFSSRHGAFDNDDTGDVFLKIAREEASRRQPDEQPADETRSVVSRTTRFSHRRPLSNVVPARQPSSPPQVRRRLSDQQETSRSRGYDDERASEVSRMSTYRSLTRDKAASVHPGEDLSRTRSTIRPSPVTPRSITFQEPSNDATSHRRPSVDNSNGQTRSSTYKAGLGHHNKTYNSSPLVRSFDFPRQPNQETSNGAEGTESTLSTTAPSTVWDELDDLKSRIHRLELTGKLPSTSGAAVSRLSDERPPTATTTVTTISSSPKRVTNGNQNADAVSTTSSHRESHPILHSALAKSKVLLDADVYRALEAAANDAMALSTMMGTVGQPGPISSGASTIGSGTTVTDRQLRRKAEGVCRSLTELCLALGEEVTQTRPRQSVEAPPPAQNDVPTTPTINKTFTGFTHQRRPSIGTTAEQNLARANTSPRAMSKFEERRLNILNGNSLPAPRVSNSTPSTPLEPISQRRSSLLVARSRRAGTEEPEDGRKSSLLLRTRRAGTEEPDEGRRTSLFVRNRRGTVGDESDDEMRFRSPSRAHTDLNAIRTATHDATPQQPASDTTSAIPRRRFASSNLAVSRLATPATNMATPPRRYLERSAQQEHNNNNNNNTVADKLAEDRGQRYMSLGQTTLINRTGSMIRRPNRDSIASANPSTAAGGYR
ncbi:hypothetical protein N0V84_010750 [Fusarium piperis]|uniref:LPXTG-motif cell wall anchor domain protein n=1 Tax=Fusarium piperis TaxID=1435070 RepID=A0A9W8W3Z8_9HYPO|nr:hypothetical protein N0V84_010750 [Fusarium piperis]